MPIKRQITPLNRQQDAELKEVAALVEAARSQIAARIREISRRASASRNATERERLYAQVAKLNEALAADLDQWGKEMVGRASVNWRRAALDEIQQQTGRNPGIAARLDREKARQYLRLIHPDNAQHLAGVFTQKMAETDIRNLRQAFIGVFRESQLDNLSANELQKAIQARWNDIAGNVEFERFIDRAGRRWTNASYLRMLVRTTTARVARESYIDTLVEHGDDLAQIRSVGDSCSTCAAWDGIIVSLSGRDERYPSYQQALDAGMFHPGCDCLLRRMDAAVHKQQIAAQAEAGPPDLSALENKTLKPAEARRQVTERLAALSMTMREKPGSIAERLRTKLRYEAGRIEAPGGRKIEFNAKIVGHWTDPKPPAKPKTRRDLAGREKSLSWAISAVKKPDAVVKQKNGKLSYLGYDGKKTIRVIVAEDGKVETWIPTSLFKQRKQWLSLGSEPEERPR